MQSNLDMLSNATLCAIIADLNKALEKAIVDCASAQADADDYYLEITDIREELIEARTNVFDLSAIIDERDNEIIRLKNKYEPKVGIIEALECVAKEFPCEVRKDKKIAMIIRFRELNGLGLKDAKDAIEKEFYPNNID